MNNSRLVHSLSFTPVPNLNPNNNLEPIRSFCWAWNPTDSPEKKYQRPVWAKIKSSDRVMIGIVYLSQCQPRDVPDPNVWVMFIERRAGRRKNVVGCEYWACSIIKGTQRTGAGSKNPLSTPQPKLSATWFS